MNLVNEEVTHKVFGDGQIIEHKGSIITVDFNEDVKKFVYPDALGKFIILNDKQTAKSMKKIISKKEAKERELEKEQEIERERQLLEQQRRAKLKNYKIHESSQIVIWLDEDEKENVFNDWTTSTGEVQSGKNKGQPNRAARLRPNSVVVLTERNDDQDEKERRILGLYMVEETFAGNLSDDGMIPAHGSYRIELTEEESNQLLFWNYYINKNHPHRMTWNSGRFRYYDNIWTAQILADIIKLKTDENDVKNVQNFLVYFCDMNIIDINDIPEANGALKQD